MVKNVGTFEELVAELEKDPEYRKVHRQAKPYYDLLLEIIKRRLELGLTQKELAKRAGTYQSRISKIEAGEHNIRLSTLVSIAEALDAWVSIRLIPHFDVDDEYRKLIDSSASNITGGKRPTASLTESPERVKV